MGHRVWVTRGVRAPGEVYGQSRECESLEALAPTGTVCGLFGLCPGLPVGSQGQ
jgi:hypothetical protein